jgi:hypothetical protein
MTLQTSRTVSARSKAGIRAGHVGKLGVLHEQSTATQSWCSWFQTRPLNVGSPHDSQGSASA